MKKVGKLVIDKATCQALWGNVDIGWEFQYKFASLFVNSEQKEM